MGAVSIRGANGQVGKNRSLFVGRLAVTNIGDDYSFFAWVKLVDNPVWPGSEGIAVF